MKSITHYIFIFLSIVPFFIFGQGAQEMQDTTAFLKENQTRKGGTIEDDAPFEDVSSLEIQEEDFSEKPPTADSVTTISAQIIPQKLETPIVELQDILKKDLEKINLQLSVMDLKYREERILKIRKEEAEYDLSFLNRIEGIKQTIAYETTGNSEAFIIAADQFLDTLYNEDTNVSDRFKDLSQERYDNYLTKDKIVKLRINDVKVERTHLNNSSEKIYKYSGFAILSGFDKKVRVQFYANDFVRKADEKLMFKVAKKDDIQQEVTIEGVIDTYKHGRILHDKDQIGTTPPSVILLKEWIVMDREQLIQDFKK